MKTHGQNILFLDIDGVLNCERSNTFYDPKHPETYGIDEHLWKNLETFLNRFPDVKVVIHSGWIKHRDDPNYEWDMGRPELGVKVKSQLQTVIDRLGDKFLDCVPYMEGEPKFVRIEFWLAHNNLLFDKTRSCLVLDDDRTDWTGLLRLENYENVYIHFTSRENGLNDVELANVLEIGDVIFSSSPKEENISPS